MYKTILITGGAGFVGATLAIKLKNNHPDTRVISLDNLKRRGSELSLNRLRENGVEYFHGDIRNKEDIDSIGPFDLMIECSAEPSVLSGFKESPQYLINTNLLGTINCLETLRQYKADIIFLSTSRVYPIKRIQQVKYSELDTRFEVAPNQNIIGISEKGISEEFSLSGPRSLYGATKLASEIMLLEYIDMYDIQGIINRCSIITGPWQMGKVDQGVIALWVAKHFFNSRLTYIGYGGKGKQVRDVLHIDDLYDLIQLQLSQMSTFNGEIYNIGGGKELSVSLHELTQLCREITGNRITIDKIKENRQADIPYYISDCTKIQSCIDWKPRRTLPETVRDIFEWIVDNQTILKPILA